MSERRTPGVEEMNLDELREEIETIAAVKREEGLPTTDERQEQAVMDRAGENARRFDVDDNLVKAIFRLLIELNKVEQRSNR